MVDVVSENMPDLHLLHEETEEERMQKHGIGELAPPPFQRRAAALGCEGLRARKGPRAVASIVFLQGVVRGAMGLKNADLLGKSDPYCVVEAVHVDGVTRRFVHQTRVISDSLTPAWNEAFFYTVPEDDEVGSVRFSIYDSDGDVRSPEVDDFLGTATVDVKELHNGVLLYEDVQLVGVKRTETKRAPGRSAAVKNVFKLEPFVVVELCVERRVCPFPEEELRVAAGLDALGDRCPPRHVTTRRPTLLEAEGAVDPSQGKRSGADVSASAAQLLAIRDLKAGSAYVPGLETDLRHLARADNAREQSLALSWLKPPERWKVSSADELDPWPRLTPANRASGDDPEEEGLHDIIGAVGSPALPGTLDSPRMRESSSRGGRYAAARPETPVLLPRAATPPAIRYATLASREATRAVVVSQEQLLEKPSLGLLTLRAETDGDLDI